MPPPFRNPHPLENLPLRNHFPLPPSASTFPSLKPRPPYQEPPPSSPTYSTPPHNIPHYNVNLSTMINLTPTLSILLISYYRLELTVDMRTHCTQHYTQHYTHYTQPCTQHYTHCTQPCTQPCTQHYTHTIRVCVRWVRSNTWTSAEIFVTKHTPECTKLHYILKILQRART